MKNLLILIVAMSFIQMTKAQMSTNNLVQAYNEKGFIENKGQIKDANGRVNKEVKYIYNKGIFNLELKQHGFSYEIFQTVSDQGRMAESGFVSDDDQAKASIRLAASARIDVVLEGSNTKANIVASSATGAYFNYYYSPVATNRIEHVNAYNVITYQNIYPGIDLVFSAPNADDETPLHYDFIIHPGADPKVIKLRYNGNSPLVMNADGSLRMSNSIGYVEEGTPHSFLKSLSNEVATHYLVNRNRVSFNVGDYDHQQTLVIDPTLVWASYFGGENTDDDSEISIDSKKLPSITGNTLSTTNIATAGAYQTTFAGGVNDLYVAKFTGKGQLSWASYLGGPDEELSFGLTTDPSNNVIIEGVSASDGLATVGQLINAGRQDAIIAKFSPMGIFQWCTYKGGKAYDEFRTSLSDSQGNLYFGGYTTSDSAITTPGTFQPIYGGGQGDCMIAKFGPAGNQLWCSYYGNDGQDRLHALDLDLFGHLIVAGTTDGETGLTTAGVFQPTYGGGDADMLIIEFDTSGANRLWCTYFGGQYNDRGRGVETDSSGNIFLAGFTDSDNGIATPGAHQINWTTGYYTNGDRAEDAFLAKFTPTGQRIWGTYYGGSGYDQLWGMTIDRRKHYIYAVGGTASDDSISTPGAWQTVKGNSEDCFFSKWDYDGNIIWGSYYGADKSDQFEDVEADKEGFIYMVGKTFGNAIPATLGAHQTHSNGGDNESDAIACKFYAGLNCYDAFEPNNTFTNAVKISGWHTSDSLIYGYNGAISSSNDQDWFRLKSKSSEPNLMIILSQMTKNYDLKFYNAQQVLLQTSNNTGTTNDTIIYDNLPNGNYYFKIAHNPSLFDSLNCYRLKVFTNPTAFTSSKTVNQFSNDSGELAEMKVFPNPATNQLSFSITASLSGKATVIVYDMLGRVEKTEEIILTEGYQSIELPVEELPSGTYNVLLKTSEKSFVASFVKL